MTFDELGGKRCPARIAARPPRPCHGTRQRVSGHGEAYFSTREYKPLNRNCVNLFIWKAARITAAMPQTRENGFHALASVLLADGVDIRSLAEYMGHGYPGFTLRV